MSQEDVKRLVDELAPVVWAERCHEAAATKPLQSVPWYFININHPTVRTIYDRYRRKAGILGPPTDLERVKFELYVLHPAVLRELRRPYLEIGALKGEENG